MMENYNMNFNESLMINTNELDWIESPSKKVSRKPLEREAAESGHVTSVVKYEAGASFPSHPHPQGEEIFVLAGTFSDEFGDYPAGTYLRNPAGTQHAPFSKDGCILFVKLNQFADGDSQSIRINTNEQNWLAGHGNLKVMPLHSYGTEGVALVKWPKGEKFIPHTHFGGEEIFVLSGKFQDEYGEYPANTWIRNKHLSKHHPFVSEETIILVKTGHLKI